MVLITDRSVNPSMDNKRFTAMFLVITMLLAGCLNADPDVDVPDVVLPDDWSTIVTNRGQPPIVCV